MDESLAIILRHVETILRSQHRGKLNQEMERERFLTSVDALVHPCLKPVHVLAKIPLCLSQIKLGFST